MSHQAIIKECRQEKRKRRERKWCWAAGEQGARDSVCVHMRAWVTWWDCWWDQEQEQEATGIWHLI